MENTEKTQLYKWAKIALIALCVVLGISALIGLKFLRGVNPAYNSITVTGQGEAVGVPDVATFYFSVSAEAKEASLAQDAVNKKMEPMVKALKELGIEERDIKTADYSVYPKYVYGQVYCIQAPCSNQQKQDGYTANQSVTVKVRETANAGKAIQAATDNGATNISGLSFAIDDPDKLMNDAREDAIEDARDKAEVLADKLGVKLVRIVSYNEGGGGGVVMYATKEQSLGSSDAVSARPAPTLPTGENKVNLTVSVTYEIR